MGNRSLHIECKVASLACSLSVWGSFVQDDNRGCGRSICSDNIHFVCSCVHLQLFFDVSIDIRVNNSNTGVSGPVGSTLEYQVIL
jgi:hypothetical protein